MTIIRVDSYDLCGLLGIPLPSTVKFFSVLVGQVDELLRIIVFAYSSRQIT